MPLIQKYFHSGGELKPEEFALIRRELHNTDKK